MTGDDNLFCTRNNFERKYMFEKNIQIFIVTFMKLEHMLLFLKCILIIECYRIQRLCIIKILALHYILSIIKILALHYVLSIIKILTLCFTLLF